MAVDENDKTEALLPWVLHEKAGFFGEDNNAGENRRQEEEAQI